MHALRRAPPQRPLLLAPPPPIATAPRCSPPTRPGRGQAPAPTPPPAPARAAAPPTADRRQSAARRRRATRTRRDARSSSKPAQRGHAVAHGGLLVAALVHDAARLHLAPWQPAGP